MARCSCLIEAVTGCNANFEKLWEAECARAALGIGTVQYSNGIERSVIAN